MGSTSRKGREEAKSLQSMGPWSGCLQSTELAWGAGEDAGGAALCSCGNNIDELGLLRREGSW